MSRPNSEMKVPDPSVSAIVRTIREQIPDQIRAVPDGLARSTHGEIFGPSVTMRGVSVRVVYSFRDADNLGSFATSVRPVLIFVSVRGCPSSTDAPISERILLPDIESEAWARAVLGPWADYAYELLVDPDLPSRVPTQTVYVAIVDTSEKPMLAPDNFRWKALWPNVIGPRKLLPDPQNTELIHILEESGPTVPTEAIRDPRTEADGGWRIDITGDDPDGLTDIARETFMCACRAFRIRGAVSSKFRTVRLELDGTLVRVYFRWAKNPNLFTMTFRLPVAESDFRSPPLEGPRAVVSTVLLTWMEELETGLIARGKRRRIGSTLHISAPNSVPVLRDGHYVSGVPLHAAAGRWLAAAGLDIGAARRAKDDGTLALWLQAAKNTRSGGPFVGQAVATWTAPGTALFSVCELVPGTPNSVADRLIRAATHRLADLGANTISTPFTNQSLAELGYVQAPVGMTLDVTTMP